MKRVVLLLMFCCFCVLAKAQSEFFVDGKKWICYENDGVEICATYDIFYQGALRFFRIDIIVGNKSSSGFNFGGESRAWVLDKKGKYKEVVGFTASEFQTLMAFTDAGRGSTGNEFLDAHNAVAVADRRQVFWEGYFKLTTITPGQYKQGFVVFRYKKGKDLEVDITVKGTNYTFRWDLPDQRNENKSAWRKFLTM